MKRPVVWMGGFLLLGILMIQFLSPKTCLLIWGAGAILLFFLISHKFIPNSNRALFLYLVLLFGMFLMISYHSSEIRLQKHLRRATQLELVVKDITKHSVVCRVPNTKWFQYFVEIPVSDVTEDLVISDHISVKWTFSCFSMPENDGAFDYKRYKEFNGILGEVKPQSITVIKKSSGIQSKILWLRERIRSILNTYLSDGPYSFMLALFTGERGEMSSEELELFQRFGIVHILAISGMHIAVFTGILGLFLGQFFRRKYAALICFLLLFLFGMLCGFRVSITRVMGSALFGMIAGLINRRKDGVTILSVVMIGILVRRPVLCMDTGFLLSFGAAFAFLVIIPCFHRERITDREGSRVVTSKKHYLFRDALLLQLFLMPVLLFSNASFSIYTVLLNLIILPFLPIVLFSGVLLLLCSWIIPIVSIICAFIITGFYNSTLWLLQLVSRLPFSTIVTGHPKTLGIIIYYLVFLIIGIRSYYGGASVSRTFIQMGAVCFLCSFHTGTDIYNLSVGQGDCSVVLKDRHAIVIDCGSAGENSPGKRILSEFLYYHGISDIDCVILSHNDKDHVSGITEISDRIPIRRMLCVETPEEEHLKKLYERCGSLCHGGDWFQWQGLQWDFLWPGSIDTEEPENHNDNSLVLLLSWNKGNALFTGDIGADVLEQIIRADHSNRLKGIDYLKVPHHGSRFSYSEFAYDYLKPRKCVISVGRNNVYGHPAEVVLEGIEAISSELHRTDRDGQSTFSIDRKK